MSNFEKLTRLLILGLLWFLFGTLTYKAIEKYFYEHIATEILYTEGDNGRIVFPRFTLCPADLVKTNLAECNNGSKNYLDAIENCLQRENSNLSMVFQKLWYKREDYFGDVFHLYEPNTTQNDQNLIWTPFIHARFGLCYSFDVEKSEKFNSEYLFHSRTSQRIDVFKIG